MKLLLIFLILLEVFFVLLLFTPVIHDNFEVAKLVVERRENPSPEIEARLAAIHSKEVRDEIIMTSVLLGFIAANGYGIFLVSRRIKR